MSRTANRGSCPIRRLILLGGPFEPVIYGLSKSMFGNRSNGDACVRPVIEVAKHSEKICRGFGQITIGAEIVYCIVCVVAKP